MANRQRGEIKLGEYHLRYTTNSICSFEGEYGQDFIPALNSMDGGKEPSFRLMRALVWAGLLDHTPGLSIADAGEIIDDLGGVSEIMPAVSEAIAAAFPDAEKGAKGKNQPRQNG